MRIKQGDVGLVTRLGLQIKAQEKKIDGISGRIQHLSEKMKTLESLREKEISELHEMVGERKKALDRIVREAEDADRVEQNRVSGIISER